MILDVAIEKGARALNPAKSITRRRIQLRELHLPEAEQFNLLVESISDAGAWCSRVYADLVRFLAYGGFRKAEAANIRWNDCDFNHGRIRVRVTKNGSPRSVPMTQPRIARSEDCQNMLMPATWMLAPKGNRPALVFL